MFTLDLSTESHVGTQVYCWHFHQFIDKFYLLVINHRLLLYKHLKTLLLRVEKHHYLLRSELRCEMHHYW